MLKNLVTKVGLSEVEDAVDQNKINREWKNVSEEMYKRFATKSKLNVYLRDNPVDSFPREIKVTEDRRGKPVFGYLSLQINIQQNFYAEIRLLKDKTEAETRTTKAKELIASRPQTTHEPSKSFALAPIIEVFKKEDRKWIGANDEAKEIFAFVEKFREKMDGLSREEMETLLSGNVAEVNSFLQRHGFDLRIQQLVAGSIFLAAVMKIIVKWVKKGEPTTIKAKNGNEYSGVAMSDQNLFMVMNGAPQGILVLNTKSKDKVCITIHPEAPESGMEAWKLCLDLMNKPDKAPISAEEWEIKFPMIDFKAEEEIPLAGSMDQSSPPVIILQSKMQNIFQMDEAGAIAKSAFVREHVTLGADFVSKRKRLIIDEPCLIWIERDGIPFPLFAGWFNYGEWNDPKDKI